MDKIVIRLGRVIGVGKREMLILRIYCFNLRQINNIRILKESRIFGKTFALFSKAEFLPFIPASSSSLPEFSLLDSFGASGARRVSRGSVSSAPPRGRMVLGGPSGAAPAERRSVCLKRQI